MPAPKGHPLWGNPLNPKKYTPQELWNKFIEYKEWNSNNPIMVVEQSKMPQRIPANYKGSLKKFLNQIIYLPHERALSIWRFCIFANITQETFDNYSKSKGYETFFEICKRIREEIDAQHFEGGMSGTFNANIVTRKLGLQEKIQSTQNIIISPMSKEEEDEIKRAMENAKEN